MDKVIVYYFVKDGVRTNMFALNENVDTHTKGMVSKIMDRLKGFEVLPEIHDDDLKDLASVIANNGFCEMFEYTFGYEKIDLLTI